MKVSPKHHVIFVNNLILQNKCISFIFIHLLLTTNQNCLITHQNYLSSVGIKICSKDYFKNRFKILQLQDIRFHSQARFRSKSEILGQIWSTDDPILGTRTEWTANRLADHPLSFKSWGERPKTSGANGHEFKNLWGERPRTSRVNGHQLLRWTAKTPVVNGHQI